MRQLLRWMAVLLLFTLAASSFALGGIGRGNKTSRRVGVHRGNQIRTSFTNYGVIGQPGNQGANLAWKYDADGYATDITPIIGVRLPVRDYLINSHYDGVADTIYSTIVCDADRSGTQDYSPDGGTFWGFEPIPGFMNPSAAATGKGVAMSHLPDTWPSFWPDHPDWIDASGNVEWNGYFGRGQLNADQESYFMMDDQADVKMYDRYAFLPDSTDATRMGQAIRVSVRGLQWSNFLAQDVMFWLYEATNVGTSHYDEAVFGTLVGTYVGVSSSGGSEYDDDASFFNVRENICYTWDFDHYIRPSANPYWKPSPSDVGYLGYAFLETPGNQYDGIDNDGDNSLQSVAGVTFSASDFEPRTVKAGDVLVLIDKDTYKRTLFTMPATTVTVTSMGTQFRLVPDSTVLVEGNLSGTTLNPNAYDGIDNDLDGLIDENYQLHYRQFKKTTGGVVLIDTLNPVQHMDYTSSTTGITMIDESREDGIDNNNNWSREADDVGLDGEAGTGDYGEGDGLPTSAYQKGTDGTLYDTGETGEPDIDKTDVEESDQVGLTSFQYFVPSTDIDMSNENEMWSRFRPGRFDVPASVVNNKATRGEDGDFIFGSGYFPMLPEHTERFSLALVFGDDLTGAIRTKNIAQIIYNSNYNFPKPPDKPTLTAVAGDKKVTLYWDKVAESSWNRTLNESNFEGYKIYKGTDPDFTDCKTISNAYGVAVDYQPIAQFDVKNGTKGLFNADAQLYELASGKPFYLGSDTGIVNTYVDEDVINGRTYYYAVTAYNRGSESQSLYPSENSKSISVDALGNVTLDQNTAVVVPNAPSPGYVAPVSGVMLNRMSGKSSTTPYATVIDQAKAKKATYYVTFNDSTANGIRIATSYNVVDSTSGDTLLSHIKRMWSSNGDIFEGQNLSFNTLYQCLDSIQVDTSLSKWNKADTNSLTFSATQFTYGSVVGIRYPYDYMFVFSDSYTDTSSTLASIFGSSVSLKQKATNFKVYDVTDSTNPVRVSYAFVDKVGSLQDTLSNFDAVYLASDDGTALSWRITFLGASAKVPGSGDTLRVSFHKPLSSLDKFVYHASAATYNAETGKSQMSLIKAVPNPYIVTNVFEKSLPSTVRGRGEHIVYFTNLPPECHIYIYASNGDLVRTLDHGSNIQNGSEVWDLKTRDGLDVAFGVYFYIVEAPALGAKKVGRLAIVK